MAELLVSVRGPGEVEPALAGGAALLDVKEPANGPLGRASDGAVAAVVRAVGGRCPVSAALGELRGGIPASAAVGFWRCAYLKPGLARFAPLDWQAGLTWAIGYLGWHAPGSQVVTVAYADAHLADSPSVEEVCAFARRRPGSVFLLDTFTKAAPCPGAPRPTLLDFLSVAKVALLSRLCRVAGVRVALAGSLGRAEIERLLPAEPDWFAVRGAACVGGQRGATVDEGRVRELVTLLGRPVRATTPAV
jgi:uncharacterized protein (UPF0264 family)